MFGAFVAGLAVVTATSGTPTTSAASSSSASSSAASTTTVDGCNFGDRVADGWLGLVQLSHGCHDLSDGLVLRVDVVGELTDLVKGIGIELAMCDT